MTIDGAIEFLKSGEYLTDAKEDLQIAEWLEELKALKDEKEYWDMQNNKAYEQGRAEGYSKAENDYFKKNEEILKQQFESGENYGYCKCRADAIAEYKAILFEQFVLHDVRFGRLCIQDVREILDDAEIIIKEKC